MQEPRDRLWLAIRGNDLATLNAAISEGAPVDSYDERGCPAIVAATRLGHLELMRALLTAGAFADARVFEDEDPASRDDELADSIQRDGNLGGIDFLDNAFAIIAKAVRRRGGSFTMVDARTADAIELVLDGSDIYFDPSMETALEAAIRFDDEEAVAVLLDHGARPRPDDWKLVLEETGEWAPPLAQAAGAGSLAIVRALVAAGAPLDDGFGITALGAAAESGHVEVVKLLLDAGADPNAVIDKDGATAIIYAAAAGQLATVRALVEGGADITVDADGATALTAATDICDEKVADYLRSVSGVDAKTPS